LAAAVLPFAAARRRLRHRRLPHDQPRLWNAARLPPLRPGVPCRGLRVISELVINHTSDQHPWFQRARRARRGTVARNFYVWSDDDKRWPETRVIFTDTEGSNWAWDPVAEQYYWHRFFSHQPDLNFDNPHVVQSVIDTMRYWLDMGIDGLRLDAIPYL